MMLRDSQGQWPSIIFCYRYDNHSSETHKANDQDWDDYSLPIPRLWIGRHQFLKEKNEVYVIHIIDKLSILPEIFLHSICVTFFNLWVILDVFLSCSVCSKSIELIVSGLYFQRLTPFYLESSLLLNLIQKEFFFRLFWCIRWRWGWLSASGTLRTIDHINRNIISKRWFS